MNTIVVLLSFSVLLVTIEAQRRFRQNNECLVPGRYIGYCASLTRCPSVAQQYSQFRRPQQGLQYLRVVQASCGTRSIRGDPVVCCGTDYVPPIQTTTAIATTTTTTTTTPRPTTQRPTTTRVSLPKIQESRSCRGPDLVQGTCKPLQDCPFLINYFQSNYGSKETAQQFLKLSNEICGLQYSVVCCPLNSEPTTSLPRDANNNQNPNNQNVNNQGITDLPTVKQGCGITNTTFKKIVGGEPSNLGAWPWIALLGYETRLDESPFKCGGAMITVRHILTAAHCIRSTLKFVRLGEHDLTTDLETKHVDINIAKMSMHDDYNSRTGHSDIAILQLAQNAPITDLILPVCLPTTNQLRTKSYTGHSPFVVGWGRTQEGGKTANVLQQLQIPVFENEVCRDSYYREGRVSVQIDNGVICAGVLEGGKDTCQGDSGGPLMFPEKTDSGDIRFYIIGIVSYGIGCARANIPGVYTNVAHFVDWVERKVANID